MYCAIDFNDNKCLGTDNPLSLLHSALQPTQKVLRPRGRSAYADETHSLSASSEQFVRFESGDAGTVSVVSILRCFYPP